MVDKPLLLDVSACSARLVAMVDDLATGDFWELLRGEGILERLARKAAQDTLLNDVTFHDDEMPAVVERLWEGIEAPPPQTLTGDWLLFVPEAQVGVVADRWDELRRQKLLDQTYGQFLDSYFLERRADLETIVYGMIRTRNQGAAEEIYLKIVDDGANFSEMAKLHSLGDERYTHGLVGPMAISQPHPSIRQVLSTLKVGETAPPLRIDPWVLILKMEHRQPAQLSEAVRRQLLLELFESDLRELLPGLMESRALTEDVG